MEKEFLSKLLNLDEENEDYLSILEEGQCLVRLNSIKRPFLLSVPLIQRNWLENSEINRNNKIIMKKLDNFTEDNIKTKSMDILLRPKNEIEKKQSSENINLKFEQKDESFSKFEELIKKLIVEQDKKK